MEMKFQAYDDNDMLLEVEGFVTDLQDIDEDEQVSNSFEFGYWDCYGKQDEPTAEGDGTLWVARDGDKYVVRDVAINNIGAGTVGETLDKDLKGILEAMLYDQIAEYL